MTSKQFLFAAFGVVIIGLILPVRTEYRVGLVLLLIGLIVFTALGGTMQYLASLFD